MEIAAGKPAGYSTAPRFPADSDRTQTDGYLKQALKGRRKILPLFRADHFERQAIIKSKNVSARNELTC
jgi:hypothetical protein